MSEVNTSVVPALEARVYGVLLQIDYYYLAFVSKVRILLYKHSNDVFVHLTSPV